MNISISGPTILELIITKLDQDKELLNEARTIMCYKPHINYTKTGYAKKISEKIGHEVHIYDFTVAMGNVDKLSQTQINRLGDKAMNYYLYNTIEYFKEGFNIAFHRNILSGNEPIQFYNSQLKRQKIHNI